MIKFVILLCLFIGGANSLQCVKYDGPTASLPNDFSKPELECSGDRCTRVQYKNPSLGHDHLSLGCSRVETSSVAGVPLFKEKVKEVIQNHLKVIVKDEEVTVVFCSGNLCNAKSNAVHEFAVKCLKHKGDYRGVNVSNTCYGGACMQIIGEHTVYLDCVLECRDDFAKTILDGMANTLKKDGLITRPNDIKYSCCKEEFCNNIDKSAFVDTYCANQIMKITEWTQHNREGKNWNQCVGPKCLSAKVDDKLGMMCVDEVFCRSENKENTKKYMAKHLKKEKHVDPKDVEFSCCSSDNCNYMGFLGETAKAFNTTCYDYAGETSKVNLDRTCQGEVCATISYEDITELSCFINYTCSEIGTNWYKKQKSQEITMAVCQGLTKNLPKCGAENGGHCTDQFWDTVLQRGLAVAAANITFTCCEGDKCNNAAGLIEEPVVEAAPEATSRSTSSYYSMSQFLLIALFLYKIYH